MKAVISMKTNDNPRIIITQTGAEVTFEIYDVSVDELRKLVGQELELTLKEY